MNEGTLTYLYGIVPEDTTEPPPDLLGLEDRPVRLVREGGVAAVVSELPTVLYEEEALNSQLSDVAWVGERGVAHERVLTWFVDRGPVIPLSLFSLHHDVARVRSRLAEGSGRLRETLESLRGRNEWGVRLWRVDARLDEQIETLSPRMADIAAEIASAPPGRRFLLTRKRDSLLVDERRVIGRSVAREVYVQLETSADRSARLAIAGTPEDEDQVLVLHAAFLVDESRFSGFQQRVSQVAHDYGERGFRLDFTGPWPPYHFASANEP